MKFETLEVRKDDLSKTRIVKAEAPELGEGEILVRVERFALTANNITYGVVGEMIGYWKFFPASDGWGVIPVWGFAEVVETKHPGVSKGENLFGYFPMGAYLVMRPDRLREDRLFDAAPHRADLPPVYNSYARLAGESDRDASLADARALLYPLYATSYCLYDFLKDNDWYGATQVIVASASSKTAIGLAYALKDDPAAPRAVALTSPGNRAAVEALGLYDAVSTYDRLMSLDVSSPAVIVDMSGNARIMGELDAFFGRNMKFMLSVGVTHADARGQTPARDDGRSAFFFAPAHIQKRAKDWGPGVFEKKAFEFWKSAAVKSRDWLSMDRAEGLAATETAFHKVREGRSSPDTGVIVTL